MVKVALFGYKNAKPLIPIQSRTYSSSFSIKLFLIGNRHLDCICQPMQPEPSTETRSAGKRLARSSSAHASQKISSRQLQDTDVSGKIICMFVNCTYLLDKSIGSCSCRFRDKGHHFRMGWDCRDSRCFRSACPCSLPDKRTYKKRVIDISIIE